MTNDERRYCRAAKQIGIPLAEYLEKLRQGLKWCAGKKHWEPVSNFTQNVASGDGYSYTCRVCQAVEVKARRKRNRERNLSAREIANQQTVN